METGKEEKRRRLIIILVIVIGIIVVAVELFMYTFIARTEGLKEGKSITAKEKEFEIVNDTVIGTAFEMEIKVIVPNGDSTGVEIKIIKNDKVCKIIQSEGIKYPVNFNFNENYLVECSKKGYKTKVVSIDTHIPEGRQEQEFARFTSTIELYKTEKDEEEQSLVPIGEVKFDPKEDDFEKVINYHPKSK